MALIGGLDHHLFCVIPEVRQGFGDPLDTRQA